jgi:hypothetical protein
MQDRQKIDSLLRQLDTLESVPAIRVQIVDLIFENLDCRRVSLDEWEKVHFANAIGSLALNVNSLHQPTKAWLRLCLMDLGKALMPESERDSGALRQADAANAEGLSCEQLLEALDSIGRTIG